MLQLAHQVDALHLQLMMQPEACQKLRHGYIDDTMSVLAHEYLCSLHGCIEGFSMPLGWPLRQPYPSIRPYFQIPMPISRLQLLMQFRMGSHTLPVEQGRLTKPAISQHLRHCILCETQAFG